MAYFARVDDGVVTSVLAVPDSEEHRGQDFLANDLGLGGTWIQTSYNHRIRKQYAGIGYTYDTIADVFVVPQPHPSWSLDDNHDWQPPVSYPTDGGHYTWNEADQQWDSVTE